MIRVTIENIDPSIIIKLNNYQFNNESMIFQLKSFKQAYSRPELAGVTVLEMNDGSLINIFIPIYDFVSIVERTQEIDDVNNDQINFYSVDIEKNNKYQIDLRSIGGCVGMVWKKTDREGNTKYTHPFLIKKDAQIETERERFLELVYGYINEKSGEDNLTTRFI